jgi:3-oxoacyl-[acyl-carrier protein] reductase
MTTSLAADVFEGRHALVTGAGRGIGRATALALAQAGSNVSLLARSLDELESTAELVRAHGRVANVASADLGDPEQIPQAIAAVLGELGAVDILINNAAVVWPLGPTLSTNPRELESAFAINVFAPMALARALVPGMLDRGWGRVINVSSGVVDRPEAMVGMNVYAATKAALEAHTTNLASEVDGTGVTVNAYRPGSVDTRMQEWIRAQPPQRIGDELHATFVANERDGTLITPETSAVSLVRRLQGEDNGQIWRVDAEGRHQPDDAFAPEESAPAAAGSPGETLGSAPIPDAELLDANGTKTTLHAQVAGRPAVIVLYRGAWCPYCNRTLRTYQQELLPRLAERGAVLIAVSPQKPDGSLSMQEKNALEFPVLSDPGNAIARALGVLTAPSAEVLAAQMEHGLDLTETNADGTTELPMPTTVVLDATGRLRWLDVHPDYTTRSEPDAILKALDNTGD